MINLLESVIKTSFSDTKFTFKNNKGDVDKVRILILTFRWVYLKRINKTVVLYFRAKITIKVFHSRVKFTINYL